MILPADDYRLNYIAVCQVVDAVSAAVINSVGRCAVAAVLYGVFRAMAHISLAG